MLKIQPTGIDLFAGAGGLTLGAHLAGINVLAAIDSDRHSIKTHKANHPETLHLNVDIRKLESENFEAKDIDLLFAGPQCQGFSSSNQRTR